jgi:hypothetical protein
VENFAHSGWSRKEGRFLVQGVRKLSIEQRGEHDVAHIAIRYKCKLAILADSPRDIPMTPWRESRFRIWGRCLLVYIITFWSMVVLALW